MAGINVPVLATVCAGPLPQPGEWAARLLPLPSSLISDDPAPTDDILTGLSVTGYFLKHMVAGDLGNRTLPDARQRLIDTLSRGAGGGA